MSKGFFQSSSLASDHRNYLHRLPKCGTCGLNRNCHSPKMKPDGEGRKRILIVGESPGKEEDRQGKALVGDSGKFLRKQLAKLNVDLNRDCWKTNAIRCHPPKNVTPTKEQLQACQPLLWQTIEELDPTVIITLGGSALFSVVEPLWLEDPGAVSRWVGWVIPVREPNVRVMPTYHPAYLLREDRNKPLHLWFKKHLRQAVSFVGTRPTVRDYESEVEVVMSPHEAALILKDFRKHKGVIAFDYETNCLKCEHPKARIYTCSVCSNGGRTIAFPWHGEVIDEMRKLLKTKSVGKVAANLKFEDRWTRRFLGYSVRNWIWDTMVAAHVLDCRSGITSLKFQAFVRLGMKPYDRHIQPYLKASDKSQINRIHQLDLRELLLYNGLDSLLEYEMYRLQVNQISSWKPGKL